MVDAAKVQALRYLGYRNQEMSPDLDALVDECLSIMRTTACPRSVTDTFRVEMRKEGVWLPQALLLLPGRDIRRHLDGCVHAALMAATLGIAVDVLIGRWARADMTRTVIFDACASALIEEVCDEAERTLSQGAEEGARPSRFSPGYGDLPLSLQPYLLDLLRAEKQIGLTCTSSYMLTPRKSVTAILGLGCPSGCGAAGRACADCSLSQRCAYRAQEPKTTSTQTRAL